MRRNLPVCPVCDMPSGYHDSGQSGSKHDAHYVPWDKVVNLRERVTELANSLSIDYSEAVKVFIAGRITSAKS